MKRVKRNISRFTAMLLAVIMIVGLLPTTAFAAGNEPAADAVVFVTGAKEGTLYLVNQPVTVKDLNADGELSYDEAMKAAHDAYCPNGYVSIEGNDGLQVGKLWGEGDEYFANALFYTNDVALNMNVGESYVEAGDRLYACSLKYPDGWNDAYTYFDKTALTVDAGKDFTLTLSGRSYMGGALQYESLKVGTWSNGSFTELKGKTFADDGKITLSFDQPGTYIVSAEGEYYEDYVITPIMPPACVVTVEEAPAKPVLNVMVNNSSNAANSNPAKAVLGEDGILRIENRTQKPTYLWLGTEEGASVTNLQFIQGLLLSNIDPSANKRTYNNVYDGTTYQAYYYSSKYQLPLVAKATVTAADGVTTADYYIIVAPGTAGQYINAITGFTSDSSNFDAASGLTFTETGTSATLNPVTTSIGAGEAQGVTWTWSTSDPTVAIVDANGKVTSIGGGTADITATYHRVTYSCKVTSTAPEHNVHTYADGICSICGTKEPKAVSAQFTLVGQDGNFVVAKDNQTELYRVNMSVGDVDCDGAVTVHDAFLTVHDTYSANGTADFVTQTTQYGLFITKLWGVETSNVAYYRNHASVYSITEELKKNDNLVAFFYRDTTGWSDLYTYFEKDTHQTSLNKATVITLKAAGETVPVGASIQVTDANGAAVTEPNATVGADGTVSITFSKPGTYTLQSCGTANGSAPVVPARTHVTVYDKVEKTVYVTLSDASGKFVIGTGGDELYRIAVKTEDDPANPDGKVTLREVLVQLHKQHHPDGADAVAATDSSVTKLWGVSGYGFGYTLNDVFLMGSGTKTGTNGRSFQDELLGTVAETGDYFNVWILQDTTNWSDTYTYFNPASVTAQAGEAVTFATFGSSMWNADGEVPVGAAVKVYDSKNVEQTALNTTVGDDGKFSITFPTTGTYRVELGTNGSTYIVPSRCMVTVEATAIVETVALDKTELSMAVGDEQTLTATVTPEGTKVTWSSSDETVAKVVSGKVTALKAGAATIKVTTNGGAEASCSVTVGDTVVAHVEALIDAIGNVTIYSCNKIEEAREAYDALTSAQKTLVENIDILTAAESTIDALYVEAAKADHKTIYNTTGKYVSKLGMPSFGGEWMVIGITRSGSNCPDGYYENVVTYVEKKINEKEQIDGTKSTENARVILALTASGYDVTNVGGHNLLMGLTDMEYIKRQGINGPIWTLIAFDSHDYEIPANAKATEQVTRDKLIDTILAAQHDDGGWALSANKAAASDPDITGMAIQSLAPYYETNAKAKAAVDEALTRLSEMQYANGSFGSIDGACSESCAQVIVALTALGINPETDNRFVKNGVSVVDALCLFAVKDGGFAHVPNGGRNGMATEQGYYALAAYFRFLDKKTSLYNMSDVTIKTAVTVVEELIDAIGEVTYDTECKSRIDAAREAYNALSSADKAKVKNYKKLTAAEATYAQLEKDHKAADRVIDLIDSIGYVTLSSENKILRARAAYNSLTYAQKKLVYNYSTLLYAEERLEELKIEQVEDLIDAIGTVTLDSKAKIERARAAYNALSNAAQKKVSNLNVLVAAEKAYEKLVKEAKEEEAAKRVNEVTSQIESISEDATVEELLDAILAFDTLTEEEKTASGKAEAVEALKKQISEMIQADTKTGISVSDVEWNIQLVVEKEQSAVQTGALQEKLGNNTLLGLWDIYLKDIVLSQEVQPDGTVLVKIPLTLLGDYSGFDGLAVVHYADDGTVEYLNSEIAEECVTFHATDFSYYAVVGYKGDSPLDGMINDEANGTVVTPWIITGCCAVVLLGVVLFLNGKSKKQKAGKYAE